VRQTSWRGPTAGQTQYGAKPNTGELSDDHFKNL